MVVSKRDSLCMNSLRSKYKLGGVWLRREPITNSSQTWKDIERLKKFIIKGAYYMVGDDSSIDVWKNSWVPLLPNIVPKPKYDSTPINPLLVSNLIIHNDRT
jgi:hypothetical protein